MSQVLLENGHWVEKNDYEEMVKEKRCKACQYANAIACELRGYRCDKEKYYTQAKRNF